MLRVGLTGGIGSGKSTVAALFANYGVPIIDTDIIARDLVQPGQPAYAEIVTAFGSGILQSNSQLNRAALRKLIFDNPTQRHRLEAILHPRIRAETQRQLGNLRAQYAIVVVPLMVETNFDDLVDRILVVDCEEATQIQRTAARDHLDEGEVRRIVAAQAARAQRLERAHDVIMNDGDMKALARQVTQLHEHYSTL